MATLNVLIEREVSLKEAHPRQYRTAPGRPHPLGATPNGHGVNFSIFAEHASTVELLLFEQHDDPYPFQIIRLDPSAHKTFGFWHIQIEGLPTRTHYAYRVDGPQDVHASGHRFNYNKVLVDPYAKGVTNALWDRVSACTPDDNVMSSMRGVVVELDDYDWEGDQPIGRPMSETIIYEVHVAGLTKSPTARAGNPGTFLGVIEKIPYLKELGITAVELLPVFDFDEKEVLRFSPVTNQPLMNYWGYSTVSFFAPHSGYCIDEEVGEHIREFRDMVKALHKAGIEVILDVVFNHTSEGNHLGPTINFKGFNNNIYYFLESYDKQYYTDFSGCGNTLNCNHPIVEKLILDCLEFWVQEMHVDGFRFDEGSVLTRGLDGAPMKYPPVIWQIELSEVLSNSKIIAEAWDAAGLYQIGYFPGYRWAEWNGRYRDTIRRFIKGTPGLIGDVAARIAGSADIYQTGGRLPINSINFVTCHDGFTLNDVVSYNDKHNDSNGEWNRDGNNDNDSWNCGVEGPTDNPDIERLRNQQVKNCTAILLLSQGTPMILGGDEIRRTQQGNNNAYCQDNEISWFDWSSLEQHQEIYRFFKQMIAFRKSHPVLHRSRFFTGAVNTRGIPDVAWHGCELHAPGWNDPEGRVLAFTMGGFAEDVDIHVMINMYWDNLDFDIYPLPSNRRWYRAIDTSRASPEDIAEPGDEVLINGEKYYVNGRSVVVLISR
jgi:glycogen operon protein